MLRVPPPRLLNARAAGFRGGTGPRRSRDQRGAGDDGGVAGAAGEGEGAGAAVGAWTGNSISTCPCVDDIRNTSARVVEATSGRPATATGKRTVYMVQKSLRYG